MAENTQPLLPKIHEDLPYYENCPGCKIDRLKQSNPNIPYKHLFYIWIVTLCAALPISSLFPFLYFMIRDFHVAKTEEDIGYYAGYVGSAFMFGRAITAVWWGMVADKYGRKPVLMMGAIVVAVLNTLFGLSQNIWMAILTRFLLGSLCGILGPIKAYASEVCRVEHQALGMSLISTSWGIGLVIGPAIGGYLAQPAEKYPNIFSNESLFGRFPYFLPCLIISLFAVVVSIICIWLPETIHVHKDKERDVENDIKGGDDSKVSLFKNWALMSSVIVYCVFSLVDMAYSEIFSLWAVSPKRLGGLSYTSSDVGEVLALSGLGLLLFQLFLYPFVERLIGPIVIAKISAGLTIPLLWSYPYMAMLSGLALTLTVDMASILKNVFSMTIVTGLFLLQNRAVSAEQRGAANGLALAGQSLFKAVGPAAGGSLFAWAQKRQHASFFPGDKMIFFILNVVEIIGLVMTFKPFLSVGRRPLV